MTTDLDFENISWSPSSARPAASPPPVTLSWAAWLAVREVLSEAELRGGRALARAAREAMDAVRKEGVK